MAIIINDNLQINAGKPVDDKYLNGSVPYNSTAEVATEIALPQRYIGLTVNINNKEYWFKNGVADSDLEEKFTAFSGSSVVIGGVSVGGGADVLSNISSSISGDTLIFRSIIGSGATTVIEDGTEIIIHSENDGVVSGGTFSGSTLSLNRTQGLPDINIDLTSISGITQDSYVTGGFYSGNTLTLLRNNGLPDINIPLATSGVTDGVVSGATLTLSNELVLSRTIGLPDVTVDLSSLSAGAKDVIITTASNVNISASTVNAAYIASGTTGYTLSATPTTGTEIAFVDGLGNALTNPITINGNGIDIVGSPQAFINTNYASFTLLYNGVNWSVISLVT